MILTSPVEMKTIRQAVVIAGGKGERLGFKTKPKPLAVIGGKPVLGHIADQCERAGIRDILVLASHMSDQIRAWANRRDGTARITVINDDPPLGTAGALKKVESDLDDQFLVTYGDMIFDVDLVRMETSYHAAAPDMMLFCQPNDHPFQSDLVEIGDGLRIQRLYRPSSPAEMISNMAASCIYLMKRNMLSAIPENVHADLGRGIINASFCTSFNIAAYVSQEWINDIGTPARLNACRRVFASGKAAARRADKSQPVFFHHMAASEITDSIAHYIKPLARTRFDRLNVLVVDGGDANMIGAIDAALGQAGVFFDEIIVCREDSYSCRSMKGSSFDAEMLRFTLNPDGVSAVKLRDICQ